MSKISGRITRNGPGGEDLVEARLKRCFPAPAWRHACARQESFSLGLASLNGPPGRSGGLAWTQDRAQCIGLAGYVSNLDEVDNTVDKPAASRGSAPESQMERLGRLVRLRGIRVLAELSGVFVLVIWDTETQTALVASDRASLAPVYYWQGPTGCAFGSEAKLFAETPQMDAHGCAERVLIGHTLGDRTLVEGVKRLPEGTVAFCSKEAVRLEKYWSLADLGINTASRLEIVSQGAERVAKSVRKLADFGAPVQILLSGGLDSRWIAAVMHRQGHPRVQSLGVHKPESAKDAVLSDRVARELGLEHKQVRFDWQRYWGSFALKTYYVEGISREHLWSLQLLPHLKPDALVFEGLGGDGLFSGSYEAGGMPVLEGKSVAAPDYADTFRRCTAERARGIPFLSKAGEFTDLAAEGIREEQKQIGDLENRALVFGWRNRLRNAMTLMEKNIWERGGVLRFPFVENEVLEFAFSIPPALRATRSLNSEMLHLAFPELTKIPTTHTVTLADKVGHRLRRLSARFRPNADPAGFRKGLPVLRALLRHLEVPALYDAQAMRAYADGPAGFPAHCWSEFVSGMDLIVWHNLFVLGRNVEEFVIEPAEA